MKKLLLVVEADYNDADYVSNIQTINKKDVPFIKKVAKAVKSYQGDSNWNDEAKESGYEGVLTQEEIEDFDSSYTPSCEEGIHTIESITIYEITKKTTLL